MILHINNKYLDTESADYEAWLNYLPGEEWWKEIILFLKDWASKSETIKLQTSGSTGKPKIVTVKKEYLINSAKKTIEFFNLMPKSKGLLCLPVSYIAGKMMLIRAIESGMHLLAVKPEQNPVKDLQTSIDFAAFTPMQAMSALNTPDNLNYIKQLIIGGGKVSPKLLYKLSYYKGHAFETFGMTETLSHIALRQLTPKYQPSFKLLQGVSIHTDKNDKLIISSPDIGVKSLKTTDRIEIVEKNKFNWLGRTDFIINSGGIKFSPELLEDRIADLIQESYCISSIMDEALGEKIVLVLEGKTDESNKILDAISKVFKGKECPKELVFIDKIPLTHTGKINRLEVKKLIQK